MKLSRKGWTLLGIGILIVAFASLGVTYLRQVNEQKQLEAELTLAEQRLTEVDPEPLQSEEQELEKQLSQLTAQLQSNTAKTTLSQLVESIDSTDTLFDIADLCNVEITDITSAGLGDDELEGLTCFSLPILVTAEGDVANLITYITRLNNDFTNGTVIAARIEVPQGDEEEEEEEEEEDEADWFQDEESIQEELEGTGYEEEEEEKSNNPRADIQLTIYNYKDGQL